MKKLFGLILVLALAIAITGCGFRPSDIEDDPDIIIIIPVDPTTYDVTFNSEGGTEIVSVTIDEGDVITEPSDPTKEGFIFVYWYLDDEQVEFDFTTPIEYDIVLNALWEADYSYNISDIPEELRYHLGDSSYNHISDWFMTDYNLDGEISEEEELLSYEDMLLYFEYDHIVTLTLEDVSNMVWGIDETMPQEYIDAAIYAIEYYDGIDWINASYVITDDLSEYRFTFSLTTQEDLYNELYDAYIAEGYEETLADEMAFEFSTNAIAFNSLSIDTENEAYNTYSTTDIYFILDSMEYLTQSEMNFVALHEMSHSFGLDDIYDAAFIGYTLMYGSAEGQDELLPILRPFDLYNLAYIYNVNQEEEQTGE